MPDVRFGIDASGAQRGYAELTRIFAGITQGAQQAADAIKAVQASGAGANQGAQRVQVLQQEVAAQEKVVVATRKRVDATAALAKEQQKQLNVALTALSTLGGEDRAYAQLTQWHIRRTKAMGEEVQVGKLLNEARTRLAASDAKAAEVFSASAVKARDLRVNMAGLNQSMSVIAGAVSKINPQLGSMIQLMSRAGRAAGNLSGGFVSLGVLAGTIGVVAAAFYGLARAADTTNRIPRLFEAIVGGLRTLIAESALGKMAIDVVTTALDKFLNLLPVAPLKVEDLNKELATLRTRYDETAAAQAELDAATTTINNLLDAHLITVEQANKLYEQARVKTIGRAGALEAEAKAVRESAQAQTEYNNALAQFRAEEEAAKATSQRLEDLQFENELLEKQIDALHRGADAVRALAVEEAGLRTVREAKQRDPAISADQEAAVRQAAQRNAALKEQIKDQQAVTKQTSQLWDNTIKDIQEAWGNLFTDLIVNGKDAFKNLGDFAKNFFGRLAGEIMQQSFSQLFSTLSQGIQAAAGGGGPGILSGSGAAVTNFASQAQNSQSVSQGVFQGLSKFFGGLFGGGAAGGGGGTTVISSPSGGGWTFTKLPPGMPVGGFSFAASVRQIQAQQAAAGGGAAGGLSITQGIPIIGGIIGGTLAGRSFIKEMGLLREDTTKLEKIAFNIGTILGGVAGGLLGAFAGGGMGGAGGAAGGAGGGIGAGGGAGIGAFLGSAIIGAIAVGQAQAIQQIFGLKGDTGGLFEAESRLQAENRAISIGLPIGLGYLLYNKVNRNIGITTGPTIADVIGRSLEGGRPITRTTPFGVIGALGSMTGGDLPDKAIESALDTVRAIDRTLARLLTEEQESLVRSMGDLPLIATSNAKRLGEKITGQRIQSVFQRLGITSPDILSQFGVGEPQKQLDFAEEILTTRKQMTDLIAAIKGTSEFATEAAEAIEKLNTNIDILGDQGETFGVVIEDIEGLRLEGLTRLATEFNTGIGDAILSLTDTATLAANRLSELQEKRLREAETLGADLVEVERLSGLERVELLKTINAPIQQILDALAVSPAGSSPVAALAAAEERFAELTQEGALGKREDIAAAAQTLLSLGEQFLGGPGFATQREEILGTLTDLISEWPVIGSEMNDQMINLSLETARGNAANEQLLSQLVDEVAGLRADNLRLQASIEQLTAA